MKPVALRPLSQRVGRALGALSFIAVALTCNAQAPAKFQLHNAGKLPRPMLMHGTAIVGNRIYILGGNWEEKAAAGNIDHWPKEVYSAEIKADSTLGPWRPETPMLETRCYIENSIQVINDRIYVLGGNVHASETSKEGEFTHSNDVEWTHVKPDGTLAPWQKSEPFGAKRSCAASCASDRYLYLVGGTTNGVDGMTDISYADIAGNASGNGGVETGAAQIDTPRNWRKAGELPIPMWYMGAAVLEDTLYVWGGYAPQTKNSQASNRVFSTVLNANGTIGKWNEESSMLTGTNSAGFCGFNDYLVCAAGRLDGGIPTSNIQFAHVQDKRVEQWQTIDSDIASRVYHSLGLDRSKGVLYITGGRFRLGAGKQTGHIVDAVQAFQLPRRQTSTVSASAVSGITAKFNAPLRDALPTAAKDNKKVLVLFYSPAVPAVERLADKVFNKPEFDKLTIGHIRAAVDVSGADQATASQYGVYRVPCLVELSGDGKMLKRSATLNTVEDVNNFMAARAN